MKTSLLNSSMKSAPGIMLQENFEKNVYPVVRDLNNLNCIIVDRIQRDYSVENGVNILVVKDNHKKYSMLNAVQIALHLNQMDSVK